MQLLAAIALAAFAVGCGNRYEITGRTPSPSGEIVALSYVGMGGGAAGWCSKMLALIPRDASVHPEELDKPEYKKELGYVFSINCSIEFSVSWTSESELRISYTIPVDRGADTFQLAKGFNGRVRLVYEPTTP